MPDYDVAAVGLSSPPAEAFKTAYRPAILVKNNGIHSADVTGYIAIINQDTGLQAFYSQVSKSGLGAGAHGSAQATDDWTPDAEGDYFAYGYVTTPHDSVPQNNNLVPTFFLVKPGTPPSPPTVPAHATQHENGGSDELEVSGLAGKLADPQDPADHAAQHQVGGDDQLSIGGLSGKAAEPQTPVTHSNAYHNPTLATSSELTAHQGATAAHSAATNLANRETTGGDTGLVKADQLYKGSEEPRPNFDPTKQALAIDRYMRAVNPVLHAFSHEAGGDDELVPDRPVYNFNGQAIDMLGNPAVLAFIPLPAAWFNPTMVVDLLSAGNLALLSSVNQAVLFEILYNSVPLASCSVPANTGLTALWHVHAGARSVDGATLKPWLWANIENTAAGTSVTYHALTNIDTPYAGETQNLVIQVTVLNPNLGGSGASYFGTAHQAGRKSEPA